MFYIVRPKWGTNVGTKMPSINAKTIQTLPPGRHRAADTLYLLVKPSGRRTWVQRLVINGRRTDLGLGSWPVVSLKAAQEKALANRFKALEGDDPVAERRRSNAPTFEAAAAEAFETLRTRWRNPKTAAKWQRGMARWAIPRIGRKPVNSVTQADVLKIVSPVLNETPDTGRKLRQSVQQVFAWAEAQGHIDHNPAQGIDAALPRKPKVEKHFKALPYKKVPEALRIVAETRASKSSKLAFRFLVLTAARSGEVRDAAWDEIDMDEKKWIIPGERMKQANEHRVPLSDAALEVLREAEELRGESGLVFPNTKGLPLSDNTISKLLRENGINAVPHGFRSSFRDWCAETGKAKELAEAALAHTVKGVEGAYFRSDLFDRRRAVMDAWARHVTQQTADVVALAVGESSRPSADLDRA